MKSKTLFLVFTIAAIIIGGTVIAFALNHINEQNKITGDVISTSIRIVDYELRSDPYGFNYLSVVDERSRGYYTQIGQNAQPKINRGDEYDLEYFCDTNNIRHIVTITPHKDIVKVNYLCEGVECEK
jgi:hypothetical protein